MPELLQWQKDIAVNSMRRQSSKEIALLLGIDEKSIADFISIAAGKHIVTKDQKLYEKKIFREKTKPVKKKVVKQKITSALITAPVIKRQEKVYKNRHHKFDDLVAVKIDSKTHILVEPGTDVEKARRDFINIINNQLTHKTPNNAIRSTKPLKGIQI